MKIRNNLMVWMVVALLSATNVGVASAASSADESAASGALMDAPKKQDADIVEILPEDFRPAFTRDTVIKLNAIVKRSYAVIEGFDEFTRNLNISELAMHREGESRKTLSDNQIIAIDALEMHAQSALADMQKAVKALESGNEHYNVAVLAGMVMFVTTVEQEVSTFVEQTELLEIKG